MSYYQVRELRIIYYAGMQGVTDPRMSNDKVTFHVLRGVLCVYVWASGFRRQ